MKEFKEIKDDQIRVIGTAESGRSLADMKWGIISAIVVALVVVGIIVALCCNRASLKKEEPSYFEPADNVEQSAATDNAATLPRLGSQVDSLAAGFTEIRDTTINDIPLRIYIPHNAHMYLHIGKLAKGDNPRIIYAAQAADVRADNGGIVGAFVLKGEPLAWGLSKKGFCAAIDGKITIGVAENTPLFEEATEKGGYFFRQYPLVSNGVLIDNEPKNKSTRRGICDRNGEIFVVETLSRESFHDYAQALVDLGIQQAVYLVGSNAYGWAVDESGDYHEFGDENLYSGRHRMPRNTSYIIWERD